MEPQSHEFAELMSMIVDLRERVSKLEASEVPIKTKASLEEVKLCCAKCGLTDDDATWFHAKMEASGWRNNGKPVRRWQMCVTAWKLAHIFPSQKHTNGNASIFGLKAALEVKIKQAKTLQNAYYDDTPFGGWTNQEARTNFIALKKEIKALEAKIGACV